MDEIPLGVALNPSLYMDKFEDQLATCGIIKRKLRSVDQVSLNYEEAVQLLVGKKIGAVKLIPGKFEFWKENLVKNVTINSVGDPMILGDGRNDYKIYAAHPFHEDADQQLLTNMDLQKFKNVGGVLPMTLPNIIGVSTWLYIFSGKNCRLGMHREDLLLPSCNICLTGRKRWIAINQRDNYKLRKLVKSEIKKLEIKSKPYTCVDPIQHKFMLFDTDTLRRHNIGYSEYYQSPGEVFFIAPDIYHQVEAIENSVAVAFNTTTNQWIRILDTLRTKAICRCNKATIILETNLDTLKAAYSKYSAAGLSSYNELPLYPEFIKVAHDACSTIFRRSNNEEKNIAKLEQRDAVVTDETLANPIPLQKFTNESRVAEMEGKSSQIVSKATDPREAEPDEHSNVINTREFEILTETAEPLDCVHPTTPQNKSIPASIMSSQQIHPIGQIAKADDGRKHATPSSNATGTGNAHISGSPFTANSSQKIYPTAAGPPPAKKCRWRYKKGGSIKKK